ncbi:DEAD/DEAH box helicase family protein [Burkholderia gladioli]|uniref:DEAD/DEAH box helicase family protein n=1 Tax=Burkholderia gladioli TaxID=28095 RepID=UPI000BEFA95D|nr:DEAD/DEAH box helicase family protein [Burkholderia gladioli]MBU9171549.1 DEAD/DEAH box helicase family protein [Burkholderia gladioli]PEH85365.1 restriction endonuclease subunit R [Burkholderia gladioli]
MAPNTNEAFSRVKIDAQLKDKGWDVLDTNSVRFEYVLPDKTKADYVLCDRNGRALAVIEAKKASINPAQAEAQAKGYAEQIKVPYIFLANGDEIRFWEWQREAFPRAVKTFFSQDDLERRAATAQVKRDPLTMPIDRHIVERDYQTECIDTLCREIGAGRRKLLVEMATGTGKTRTAAAFIKRLFEANAVTRVLFLVDRIPLARQTEDVFVEHLTDYPSYVLRAGRRFQDEKRITITTLQSMVNIYRDYSSGYFDLVISDECHRSIYGKWSGVLKHFDGIQVGLTATPCVANPEDFGDDEDKLFIRDTLRFFEVDRPTFSYKMKDAIRDGYLVPYQVFKAKTVKTAADGGFPVSRKELDWSAMDAETHAELEALFGSQDTIVVDPSVLERKFTIPERNRAIVREFREVLTNGFTDAQRVLRKPLIGKTIVFAVNKRHAETLATMFDKAFADQKPSPDVRYADYVVSGAGPDDTADGMTKIKRFKKEPFPQILVSVNMLDTGFDCPEVVNLIFARFTRSAILYQQMRGRGTRKAKGKPIFTLFDFVGVTDYHGDIEGPGEGGIVVERPRKPRGEPRKLISLDVDDHIDPATREWIMVDENGNMVFPEASEQRRAEIGARFEAWMLEREDALMPDQQRWLLTVGSQLRANADTWDEFTTGHFAFPPFTLMGGLPEAARIFGGDAKLGALLDGLNTAVYLSQGNDSDSAVLVQQQAPSQH